MHEMSIMARVFEIIEEARQEHQLEKINSVELKIGQLTCVEESALQFAFSVFADSNDLQEAELKIDWVSAEAKCDNCGVEFAVEWKNRSCPNCDNFCQQLLTGKELYLSKLEGE